MNFNTYMFKKIVIGFFVTFVIVTVLQLLFMPMNIPETDVKVPVEQQSILTENLKIDKTLSESEAIELLSSAKVTNIIQENDYYIVRTEDNMYSKLPITNNVNYVIQLQGLTIPNEMNMENEENLPVESEESSGLSGFFSFLITLVVLSFICNLVLKIWREKAFLKTAEKMVFSEIGNNPEEMGLGSRIKKDDAKVETTYIKKVTFDDVQGIEELKPDLYRLVDCLKNPKKYQELGARMPKGVILYGPPGTGKTLIAKALAGEAGVPFHSACGSDFVEKYVGVGAQRVRELYKQARKSAPCIVFIDEIDAIGGNRGESNNGEKDQTINALLAELDGFKSGDNILTICATNRLDILDPALMRAGRFDLKLAVGLPDKEGREAILKVHSKNKKLAKEVSIPNVAKQTVGFSGAELESLMNESALIAAASDKKSIDNEDIENAFFKIIMQGNKKKNKKEDDKQLELIAWHESGHTLVTKLLTKTGVPTVTIIGSTSGAGGVTFMSPEEEKLASKKDLRNEIKISYGGRAAEELLLGNSEDITTGASADIRSATQVIKSYISNYGMGNKGLLDVKQLTSQYDVLDEATDLSNTLYQETLDFLRENIDKLKALANALLEKETLYEDEIDVILGLKTAEEVDLEKRNREGLFGKAENQEENVDENKDNEESLADFREIRNGKFLPEVEDLMDDFDIINDFSSNLDDVDEEED